jgi:hypothetical protein
MKNATCNTVLCVDVLQVAGAMMNAKKNIRSLMGWPSFWSMGGNNPVCRF